MLNLKVGVTKNPRFEPLIDGSVKSAKADLNIHVTTPPELFFKNLKNDEFDIFEMSLSEFLITREQAKGDRWQWAALPIFPAKAFVWMTLFANTGAGIEPDHLKRIFDLYFTTREKGSGIGLSMVYRTVQLHDGEIEVQSTPGVGTTVRMLLPQV